MPTRRADIACCVRSATSCELCPVRGGWWATAEPGAGIAAVVSRGGLDLAPSPAGGGDRTDAADRRRPSRGDAASQPPGPGRHRARTRRSETRRPDRVCSRSAIGARLIKARTAFDMVGNLVAKVATRCRAEPGDLYAATLVAGSDGRPTPDLPMTGPARHLSLRGWDDLAHDSVVLSLGARRLRRCGSTALTSALIWSRPAAANAGGVVLRAGERYGAGPRFRARRRLWARTALVTGSRFSAITGAPWRCGRPRPSAGPGLRSASRTGSRSRARASSRRRLLPGRRSPGQPHQRLVMQQVQLGDPHVRRWSAFSRMRRDAAQLHLGQQPQEGFRALAVHTITVLQLSRHSSALAQAQSHRHELGLCRSRRSQYAHIADSERVPNAIDWQWRTVSDPPVMRPAFAVRWTVVGVVQRRMLSRLAVAASAAMRACQRST